MSFEVSSPSENLHFTDPSPNPFKPQGFPTVPVSVDPASKVKHACTGAKQWRVQEIYQNPFLKWGGKTCECFRWLLILLEIKTEQSIPIKYLETRNLNL